MKKFFNAIIVLIAFHSSTLISQEVEETVVITSALINTSEITNPLYVIDGEKYQTMLLQAWEMLLIVI